MRACLEGEWQRLGGGALVFLPLAMAFRAVSALTYWLTRRLTPAGMLITGVLVASAALGVGTHQTVAYKIFALALSAGVCCDDEAGFASGCGSSSRS